jgi:hypothetical protein
VTITNTSGASLPGPMDLALAKLTAGVTLVNATGTAADGSPEIALDLGTSGVLVPGQVVSLLLRFADPSLVQIAYTPNLLAVPTAAAAVTGQASLQFGDATFDSATGRYVESVTITNTSTSTFVGPLALALDGLTPGVSLFNASGTTSATSPAGSPYQLISLASALQPGQSVTIVLQFVDQGQVAIGFHARLLEGPGAY